MPEANDLDPPLFVVDAVDDSVCPDDDLPNAFIINFGDDPASFGKPAQAFGVLK